MMPPPGPRSTQARKQTVSERARERHRTLARSHPVTATGYTCMFMLPIPGTWFISTGLLVSVPTAARTRTVPDAWPIVRESPAGGPGRVPSGGASSASASNVALAVTVETVSAGVEKASVGTRRSRGSRESMPDAEARAGRGTTGLTFEGPPHSGQLGRIMIRSAPTHHPENTPGYYKILEITSGYCRNPWRCRVLRTASRRVLNLAPLRSRCRNQRGQGDRFDTVKPPTVTDGGLKPTYLGSAKPNEPAHALGFACGWSYEKGHYASVSCRNVTESKPRRTAQ